MHDQAPSRLNGRSFCVLATTAIWVGDKRISSLFSSAADNPTRKQLPTRGNLTSRKLRILGPIPRGSLVRRHRNTSELAGRNVVGYRCVPANSQHGNQNIFATLL